MNPALLRLPLIVLCARPCACSSRSSAPVPPDPSGPTADGNPAMTYEARAVSETLGVDADTAYAFARRIENLPSWAAGLASGLRREGDTWYADSPMGRVAISMVGTNPYRVLDHDVTLPNGTTVHNALRITPNGDGSVITFVVLRMPEQSRDQFENDIAAVRRDLAKLKQILGNGDRDNRKDIP